MRTREPDQTRKTLLEAAFNEFHRNGFRAASLDRILQRTHVTKGALYHHFPNKQALGYAVVEEIIWERILDMWIRPIEGSHDPLGALIETLRSLEVSDQLLQLGCPLNNLAQEMSPVDETFRRKIEGVFRAWRSGIASSLRRGQKSGTVSSSTDPEKCAAFIVATLEGAVGLAKSAQDISLIHTCKDTLIQYLEGLRPKGRRRGEAA